MDAKTFQAAYYAARLLHPKVKVSARIPLAQSAIEAGSTWNSNLAVTANNLFGMKKPEIRKTTAIGKTDKGFAIFNSQYSSINDFILFLDQLGLYTDDQLMKYIVDGKYTHDAGYLAKVNRMLLEQAPKIIPPVQMYAVAGASAIGLACGVKLISALVAKFV